MKISTNLKVISALTLIAIVTTISNYRHQPIPISEAKPLITGKWFYNPGACFGKLPRNGVFDVSIFTTNPDVVVVNKIVLDEGRISELDNTHTKLIQEKIHAIFEACDKVVQPNSTPTMFHYKHPLKEFSLVYYPKEDLLIQTNKHGTLIFQRLSSIKMSQLKIVDSL